MIIRWNLAANGEDLVSGKAWGHAMAWDPAVLVALLTFTGGLATAALSYLFGKRQQLEAQWRNSKLDHYRELLSAISDLAVDNGDVDAHRRFALAVNTIGIVAPQNVVMALLDFHDEIKVGNPERVVQHHDELLSRLILAIRSDLGITPKDDSSTFHYHLVGSPPGSTKTSKKR